MPPNFEMKRVFVEAGEQESFQVMGDYKLQKTPAQICSDEEAQYLIPLLEEAYSYGYTDEPRYGILISMMELMLIESHCIPDKYFTWFNPGFIGREISQVKYNLVSSAELDQAATDEDCVANQMPAADFVKNNNIF